MAKLLNVPVGELTISLGLGDIVVHVIKETGEVKVLTADDGGEPTAVESQDDFSSEITAAMLRS
jgi:hypothetical protein